MKRINYIGKFFNEKVNTALAFVSIILNIVYTVLISLSVVRLYDDVQEALSVLLWLPLGIALWRFASQIEEESYKVAKGIRILIVGILILLAFITALKIVIVFAM